MTTTHPFSLLAHVYDAIMEDINYDAWAEHILTRARDYHWHGTHILDLGCGTGNSSGPFLERGFCVTGVDLSPDMLIQARQKYPRSTYPCAQFAEGDFTQFVLSPPADLAISLFDSVNNLLDPAHFSRMAEKVFQSLRPEGLFIFDINTTRGLKVLWEQGRMEGWSGDVYFRWQHTFDAQQGLAHIEAYCEHKGQTFTEIHTERPYDGPEVKALLEQAGFIHIEISDFYHEVSDPHDAVRLWVVAQKPL